MRIRIGTSGYSYKEWVGTFYPEKLPQKRMLAFYAEHFSTVEINNSFYRMPSTETLGTWAEQVPPDFVFVLKAPQRISHQKRLKDCAEDARFFFQTGGVLGGRLGPSLVQLPPFMKKDVGRLEAFLGLVPEGQKIAFEFRHESWFEDDVYDTLRRHGAALCVADADEFAVPFVVTAPFGYLRLRRKDYDESALRSWAERVTSSPEWNECFVFFKHEDSGTGPRFGKEFGRIVEKNRIL